jgi:hypothetical protein
MVFASQVDDGVIPAVDEYQCLNEVDARLHVIKLNTRIGLEHSNNPQGSLNRYKGGPSPFILPFGRVVPLL